MWTYMLSHKGGQSDNILIKGSPPLTISRQGYSKEGGTPSTLTMIKMTKKKLYYGNKRALLHKVTTHFTKPNLCGEK
jgi:hypothetical protein